MKTMKQRAIEVCSENGFVLIGECSGLLSTRKGSNLHTTLTRLNVPVSEIEGMILSGRSDSSIRGACAAFRATSRQYMVLYCSHLRNGSEGFDLLIFQRLPETK